MELNWIEDGTITCARGFKAAGMHAGFRKNPNQYDLALVEADNVCVAAGVFTQNVFCAAPVQLCRERLEGRGFGTARAIMVNTTCANAATGPIGLDNARAAAALAAEAIGCAENDVLVASTGVIGTHLPLEPFELHLGELHAAVGSTRAHGHDAAHAILTTDTVAKECAVSWVSDDADYAGVEFTIGGICKGSGMIMPNMATMIALLTTDVPLVGPAAYAALQQAVAASFNKVTVDSDTSTNDTCLLLSSDTLAFGKRVGQESVLFAEFAQALILLCTDLARKMARDGEGATRLVTVSVSGAATDSDADLAARTVANSPLVKTAIAGHDANWGRVAAALGRSGAVFSQENVDIDIVGLPVLRAGLPVPFSEEEAAARFEQPEVSIDVKLGQGEFSTQVWTCDFTHEYISINGDYRS